METILLVSYKPDKTRRISATFFYCKQKDWDDEPLHQVTDKDYKAVILWAKVIEEQKGKDVHIDILQHLLDSIKNDQKHSYESEDWFIQFVPCICS